ncbi:MAG: DUF4197 family protein [Sphaerochaetaceae bacterium]|nr:DUF4197 family protein [Sphaerochaetaceae bacterium]
MKCRPLLWFLCLLMIGLVLSCRSTDPIAKTPEEIAFAREAVLVMMEETLVAASGNISRPGGWTGTTADLVPSQAAVIVQRAQSVPGIPRLLSRYLGQMNEAVVRSVELLPEYLQKTVFPSLAIPDPFSLIEGEDDAVTRYFASIVYPTVETWLESRLRGEEGKFALESWRELLRTYHTYNRSQFLMRGTESMFDGVEVNIDPIRSVVVTVLRLLLEDMRTQEALVRTMAPAYDNPLITLYVRP